MLLNYIITLIKSSCPSVIIMYVCFLRLLYIAIVEVCKWHPIKYCEEAPLPLSAHYSLLMHAVYIARCVFVGFVPYFI